MIGDNGFMGFYQGRIGNLSYYVRNGRQVARRCGWKVSKLPSGAQLASRMKMALMVDFLRPLLSVVNLGFALKTAGTRRTSYNLALGYNLRNGVAGAYPEFTVNYEKVRLSLAAGEVAGPYMAAAVLQEDGLLFSWQMEGGGSWNYNGDRAVMVAYFPERAAAVFDLDGPERSDEKGMLKLGPAYRTLRMEVYLAFVAADRSGISDSIYLGNLNG